MTGINPFDLVCPEHNLLTAPRQCAGCGGPMPSLAASYTPFRNRVSRPDPHADCRKRLEAERVAKADALLAEALADWERLRALFAGQPLLLAVLDLHQPQGGYAGPDCAECEQGDGMESTQNVPWPCPTYTAITSTPEQAGEPEQRPLAPIEITLTVQNGLSDRQLHDAISDAIRRQGMYRPTRTC